ncbi:hypothetical protein PHYBLDRAFT_59968 [Phycomyces blakesleeanus NRRL 1555(-)]|uniref:Uncharacterized protein n=1 Tax=Phycomyces blakesleeanus (strain ATCC 8743b / DSM 1359 / FGSC 10004 / NBRC 33097 / NRRL 1555) TaxID=763407 RepID=A0A167NQ25_PHYB8|nr:hypothetical protein PHYBLDRAFT_59968 [Phycomyces blakesleeanus NRRL 1555(-)]OAD76434.1 hypothetical protein PHYBLDRAFT_59968 [Phycomyces blakesleeanus NRRL 1555(-)]|eukprot:XP_018294474.1 hypothetical protein PHYBLDRAFT_59968 [Phycomyces blakesleeanus NRRL 1555(-)]
MTGCELDHEISANPRGCRIDVTISPKALYNLKCFRITQDIIHEQSDIRKSRQAIQVYDASISILKQTYDTSQEPTSKRANISESEDILCAHSFPSEQRKKYGLCMSIDLERRGGRKVVFN